MAYNKSYRGIPPSGGLYEGKGTAMIEALIQTTYVVILAYVMFFIVPEIMEHSNKVRKHHP